MAPPKLIPKSPRDEDDKKGENKKFNYTAALNDANIAAYKDALNQAYQLCVTKPTLLPERRADRFSRT